MKSHTFVLTLFVIITACFTGTAAAAEDMSKTSELDARIQAAVTNIPDDALPGGDVTVKKSELPTKHEDVWAVLVGHNIFESDPQHLPEYSSRDVTCMASALIKAGTPAENIVQMTTQQKPFYLKPTRDNILSMLRMTVARADENDSLWVMFSGIGVSLDDDPCFLPTDTNLTSPDGWILFSEIRSILTQCRAKRVTLLWLANRTNVTRPDASTASSDATSKMPQTSAETGPASDGRYVVFSCSLNTFAEESNEANADLFLSEFLAVATKSPTGIVGDLAMLFDEAKNAVIVKTGGRNIGPQTAVLEPLF